MANNLIQVKRTSISGRAPNTSILQTGELALNMADGILYSSNGTSVFEIGANNTNVNISGNLTVKSIIANNTLGSPGQVLTTNGSNVYWSNALSGATGFIGSIGYRGSEGNQGSAGYQGSLGFTGYIGSIGYEGSIGVTGNVGYQGSTGNTGYQGSFGNVGYQGSAGIGFSGSSGSIGGIGYQGSVGNIGFQGSAGAGFAGSFGSVGYQGSAGAVGASTNSIRQTFVGNGTNTQFTVAGGYNPGQLDVFLNGVKLNQNEVVTSSGSTFIISTAPPVGAVIEALSTFGSFDSTLYVNTTSNYTLSGNIKFSNTITAVYSPATTTGVAINATGKDSQGGVGYFDFLRATNITSGATNPNKSFRLTSTGTFEIINSAYSATLMSVSDTGFMSVSGAYQVNGKQAVNGPAFRAYVGTGQTITSGSQQKVTFDTENFDTNNNFTNSTFTPTLEGYYQFNAVVRISGTASTGEVMLVLYKNGSEYARGTNESGTEQGASFYSMSISDIAYANGTGDYFDIYIQQSSGGNRTTTAGSTISHFSGCMVRGA